MPPNNPLRNYPYKYAAWPRDGAKGTAGQQLPFALDRQVVSPFWDSHRGQGGRGVGHLHLCCGVARRARGQGVP